MTMFLENRTISMILTVPNVKELSHSVDNLDSFSNTTKPPSIPIYHGSIIHIEQHHDSENTSDLIVRVPNFHHLSLPSVTISINDNQLPETASQREVRMKRRAPICPIFNGTENRNQINETDTSNALTNTKRLAIGLRHLRETIITNRKSKRSTNINEITIIPVLPDVEVITEDFQIPTLEKKSQKNSNSTSKFLTPKILFIKRKYLKIKKKQSPSNSIDSETNTDYKTNENSCININAKENDIEQQNQSLELNHQYKNTNFSAEPQSTTTAQLISNIPISIITPESSSTHIYSDSSSIETPATILPPKTKIDSTADIPSFDHTTNENIEERFYIVRPDGGDTYSECYEVTYEFDPEFQQFINNQKEQIYLPDISDQPSINLNLDPFEYQDLTSSLAPWFPIYPSNNYEQIDQTLPDSQSTTNLKQKPRVKFQSSEDVSPSTPDQTSTYPPVPVSDLSSSDDHHQVISFNPSPIVHEDYTILLQFLRHALQIESTPDNDYDEFNKQIQQLFQTDSINQLE